MAAVTRELFGALFGRDAVRAGHRSVTPALRTTLFVTSALRTTLFTGEKIAEYFLTPARARLDRNGGAR